MGFDTELHSHRPLTDDKIRGVQSCHGRSKNLQPARFRGSDRTCEFGLSCEIKVMTFYCRKPRTVLFFRVFLLLFVVSQIGDKLIVCHLGFYGSFFSYC